MIILLLKKGFTITQKQRHNKLRYHKREREDRLLVKKTNNAKFYSKKNMNAKYVYGYKDRNCSRRRLNTRHTGNTYNIDTECVLCNTIQCPFGRRVYFSLFFFSVLFEQIFSLRPHRWGFKHLV